MQLDPFGSAHNHDVGGTGEKNLVDGEVIQPWLSMPPGFHAG